jgi:hypothetical protein
MSSINKGLKPTKTIHISVYNFILDVADEGAVSHIHAQIVGRDSSVGIVLTTGWTVWGSNSGGDEIFRTRPDRP